MLRPAFIASMERLLDWDDEVVLVLGDISSWAFRHAAAKHPKRVLNLGVTEQGSVSFCAGLAMSGMFPVFHTIDSFLRRCYEQVYLDFGIQKVPGLFITVGGSADYAKLGPTHMAGELPLLMAQVPGMHIRMPVTPGTVDLAICNAARCRQLAYIRLEESLVTADTDNIVRLPTLGANNGHAVTLGTDG